MTEIDCYAFSCDKSFKNKCRRKSIDINSKGQCSGFTISLKQFQNVWHSNQQQRESKVNIIIEPSKKISKNAYWNGLDEQDKKECWCCPICGQLMGSKETMLRNVKGMLTIHCKSKHPEYITKKGIAPKINIEPIRKKHFV